MSEPLVASMAEVRGHLADVIDRARRGETPTIITRRGKEVAVVLDVGEYRRLKQLEEQAENAWLSALAKEAMAEGGESVSMEEMAAMILRDDEA